MSKLLIRWVNENVGLSREVTSIENDFSDGYLLGELLNKFNQQHDFSKFSNAGGTEAKLLNFNLLGPSMRALGVHFNAGTAKKIMSKDASAAKTLLYELKTALESFSRGYKKTSERDPPMLRVIEAEKPLYNNTMSVTFETAIRASTALRRPGARDRDADSPPPAHTERTQTASTTSTSYPEGDYNYSKGTDPEFLRAKELAKNRARQEKEAYEAWESGNVKQWKTNQLKARARRQMDETFTRTMTAKTEAHRSHKDEAIRRGLETSIAEFETTLRSQIFNNVDSGEANNAEGSDMFFKAGGNPGTGIPELMYLNPDTLKAGLTATQAILKERHDDAMVRQQARMRRRKRFVRERESYQNDSLVSSADCDVANQLLNMSKSEEVERLAKSRVLVYHDLMKENVRTRVKFESNLECEMKEDRDRWEEVQRDRELSNVIGSRLVSQSTKLDTLHTAAESASSYDAATFASGIVDRVLDLVDWTSSMKAFGVFESSEQSDLIPPELWRDGQRVFGQHVAFADALPFPQPSNLFPELPHSLSERPLCIDQEFLSRDLLSGETVLAAGELRSTHTSTAELERGEFVHTIASAELAGADNVVESKVPEFHKGQDVAAAAASVPTTEGGVPPPAISYVLVHNPEWLFKTPAKHLLGGTIAHCRWAARSDSHTVDEDSDVPKKQAPPKITRIALLGPSDSLRKAFAKSLASAMEPAPRIICVHDLISYLTNVENQDAEDSLLASLPDDVVQDLSKLVFDDISSGGLIKNETYSKILLPIIEYLENESQGYIIEDYFVDLDQSQQFLQYLTGIDRSTKRHQVNDGASPFAQVLDAPFVDYEKSFRDFDFVFDIQPNNVTVPVEHRFHSRIDLQTGSVVIVDSSVHSITKLAEVHTPDKPADLLSVELDILNQNLSPVQHFFSGLRILHKVDVEGHDQEKVDAALSSVLGPIIPVPEKPVVAEPAQDSEGCVDGEVRAESPPADSNAEVVPVVVETPAQTSAEVTVADTKQGILFAFINSKTADALASLWSAVEQQSLSSISSFYESLRDVRYHTVQRRRCIHDVVKRFFNQRDSKQQLFEDFRKGFNEVEDDFRFDDDLKAELHLRALELRQAMWAVADARRTEIEKALASIAADDAVALAVHRAQSEGVSLLQSEVDRFIIAVDMSFDYLKLAAAYPYTATAGNTLEECLPPLENLYDSAAFLPGASTGKDAKGGKAPAAAKGGKGAPEVKGPSRNPIAPILMNSGMMSKLPPRAGEAKVEEVDPKAKGAAAKGKKGAAEETNPTNALAAMVESVNAVVSAYSEGTFTADRTLFPGNECVAEVLDRIVWVSEYPYSLFNDLHLINLLCIYLF